MKKLLTLLIVIAAVIALYWFCKPLIAKVFAEKIITQYSTQAIRMGDLRRTIESTGTVEPEELVNVGAQIGGMVISFGKDADGKTVDYGSKVKAGTLLAQIDDSLYLAERDIARANCAQGEASIASAKASLEEAQAQYNLAESDWKRISVLFEQGVTPKSEKDTALSAYEKAKAALALNKAKLMQAEAQLVANKANLAKAERNLGYCVINSPVDGVIIDRRVNIGQTVNASMNAPSLFLIAKDLRRMQVWVSVNEADVGEIKPGLKTEFTVDAFPNRIFHGVVRKTRLNATMSQNVVTFVVEIDTDNSDGTLLPYLTANVKFILAERKQVPIVSNAALRYHPGADYKGEIPPLQDGERLLWVKEGETIRPVVVRTGLNDGTGTEIVEGDLAPGAEVVTGSRQVTERELKQSAVKRGPGTGGDESNPFLPKMPKRPNQGKKK